jgi:hypothetical protein
VSGRRPQDRRRRRSADADARLARGVGADDLAGESVLAQRHRGADALEPGDDRLARRHDQADLRDDNDVAPDLPGHRDDLLRLYRWLVNVAGLVGDDSDNLPARTVMRVVRISFVRDIDPASIPHLERMLG